MVSALLVIAILVLLIVVHEFGHFIAAKLFRIRVEEFGVGYPPRALLFGKVGDTEYTLNWLPFGGFVRLFGEEEDAHGRGSFADASRWKQAIVLVAGVTMNTVAAWALFAGALHFGIPRVVPAAHAGQNVNLVVTDIVAGSPAEIMGIRPGDSIIGVSDATGAAPAQLAPTDIVNFISARGGQTLSVSYVRAGATSTVNVKPANAVVVQNAGRPAIGIGLALVSSHGESWGIAFADAFTMTKDALGIVGGGLWTIVAGVARGTPNLSDVVGPVGLAGAVSDAARNGIGDVLSLAAFISINLAIVNLIPIPALDGGRLFLLCIEAVLRKSAPRLAVQVLNALGIALIILLMVTVTYNDIGRLLN